MISLRTVKAEANRWSDGSTHAAVWFKHDMWSWGWYALCTREHVHGGLAERVRRRDVLTTVTCTACRKLLTTTEHQRLTTKRDERAKETRQHQDQGQPR